MKTKWRNKELKSLEKLKKILEEDTRKEKKKKETKNLELLKIAHNSFFILIPLAAFLQAEQAVSLY